MIIFDLDGTLADYEHRRHFVDPHLNLTRNGDANGSYDNGWKPDWDAFYEKCYQDTPIYPVWDQFNHVKQWHEEYRIWSGRSESVRQKTIAWLMNKCPIRPTYWNEESWNFILKMRPIGDFTPDDVLKEKWLDEELAKGNTVEYVFDDRPKVVRMWRRRGIFVFNCAQNDKEF